MNGISKPTSLSRKKLLLLQPATVLETEENVHWGRKKEKGNYQKRQSKLFNNKVTFLHQPFLSEQSTKISLKYNSVAFFCECRAHGAVFKSAGAAPLLNWGGGGGGGEGQIWLFSFCGCLELSDCWTFLESLSSGVMFINFKLLKSTFLLLSLIARAAPTSRSLQIMILHCRSL